MAIFEAAYQRTLGFEGKVLEDVSGDPGGETFYGISRKNFPGWPGWAIIDGYKLTSTGNSTYLRKLIGTNGQLPRMISDFYKANFWNEFNLDMVTSQAIAEEIFDTAVNCGTFFEGKITQRALNVLNKQGTLWADLKVDGVIGPVTAGIINKMVAQNPDYERQFLKLLNGLQGEHYVAIAEKNPELEKFMYGWLKQRVS